MAPRVAADTKSLWTLKTARSRRSRSGRFLRGNSRVVCSSSFQSRVCPLKKRKIHYSIMYYHYFFILIYFYTLKMHKILGFRPLKYESTLLSFPESLYEILYFIILLYHTFICIKNHSFVRRYYFVFHIEIHNSFIQTILKLFIENLIYLFMCKMLHSWFSFAITAISHICVSIEMGGHRFELPKLDLRPSSTSPPPL